MELRLRENWQDFVTAKEIEKHNKIVDKANKKGVLSHENGLFLVNYDMKTRVCNTCGRTPQEAKMWGHATFENAQGETISCGLMANCFECEMLSGLGLGFPMN